ncbi:acyltransferase [Chloropicon primus]|nr:acyltransferase [Chloropicon primus]
MSRGRHRRKQPCKFMTSEDVNVLLSVEQGENGEKKGGEASAAEASWRFVYRPEIDGLRFWAVMPVLFYHYGAVFGFTGGYAGVDVFFVISGYLITSIVLRELCMGKSVLRHFWERRVRRLFPAIATMFVCLYIHGWFMLSPNVYNNFVGESIFGLIAGSNFYYYVTTKDLGGYMAAGPEAYPLLHFWSLAVEEQFYMVLPVVLTCVWRFCKTDRKRWMWTLGLLGFVLLASFAFSVGYTPINNPFCFYLLFARAWELAIGSFVGIATSDVGMATMSRVLGLHLGKRVSPLAKRLMLEATGWLGFGLILFVYFYFTREMEYTYPYYYALGPCVGALMVIVGNTPVFKPSKDLSGDSGDGEQRIMTTCGLFLSFAPFVWIGKISYALYLWHWPLWCFQGGVRLSQNNVVSALVLTMVAIGLSDVSTQLIEQPFRSAKRVGRKPLWILSGIVWTALLSFSIAVHVLEVGGSNKTIAVPQVEDGMDSSSTVFVPTGSEPQSFFLEDANPELFSVEGIEKSSTLSRRYREELKMLMGDELPDGECKVISDKSPAFDECPGAEDMIVYNEAGDPPCLAFLGNSHLGHHILTIASLAKEYDVSYLWLKRPGRGDLFGGCGSTPDPPSPWDEQRIRILKQWKPKRVIFATHRPYCLLANNSTLDGLMSGAPEKVLIMGDNPLLDYGSFPFKIRQKLQKELLNAIKVGDVSSLDFLSTIKPKKFDDFLRTEDGLRKAIESNPKYNGTIQFESTYPAFMDQNNAFVQVVGAETEGGNRMTYADLSHLSADGSERLREYFREHIFGDLDC